VFSTLLACAQRQGAAGRDDLSGEWILTEQVSDETQTRRMRLQMNRSGGITGQSGPYRIEGALNGPDLTLRWLTGSGRLLSTYTGRFSTVPSKGTLSSTG
jgi:hypothetical protein